MTQTLIEKLEELQKYEFEYDYDEAIVRGSNDGAYILVSDLRAIIEEAKSESQEPDAYQYFDEGNG